MARRSSGGGGGGRRSSSRSSRPAARAPSPTSNTPKPAAAAPPHPVPAQGQSGSVMGSLGATIADGLAWGTGTSIAHRAMDALMGPRVIKHETVASSASDVPPAPNTNGVGSSTVCADQSKALIDCLEGYGSDISKCQFYMDMLHQCRQNSGTLSA
ncbi:hypothetical protein ACB094_12G078500 [Castanea mollissima]